MSFNPGTNQAVLKPTLSLRLFAQMASETMDPPTPVEYGRVLAGANFGAATPATELPVNW